MDGDADRESGDISAHPSSDEIDRLAGALRLGLLSAVEEPNPALMVLRREENGRCPPVHARRDASSIPGAAHTRLPPYPDYRRERPHVSCRLNNSVVYRQATLLGNDLVGWVERINARESVLPG